MILQLLKKDCIIAKNYVAAVILIGVGLPVLLVWKQPQMLEVFALPGAVFISSVAFNLAVSEKENMYPKATALLCATPYNRGKLVEEKYLLYFLIRYDTVLERFPLYCPKCKQETLISVRQQNISVIKEPDAKTQSR